MPSKTLLCTFSYVIMSNFDNKNNPTHTNVSPISGTIFIA